MNKNLLSENMLRFGTKNLSPTAQRELVLKSIMETVNQHGLHHDIYKRLIREAVDPDLAKVHAQFVKMQDGRMRTGWVATATAVYLGIWGDSPEGIVRNWQAQSITFTAPGASFKFIGFVRGTDLNWERTQKGIHAPESSIKLNEYPAPTGLQLTQATTGFDTPEGLQILADANTDQVNSMMYNTADAVDVCLNHLNLRKSKLSATVAEIKQNPLWPKLKPKLEEVYGNPGIEAILKFIG